MAFREVFIIKTKLLAVLSLKWFKNENLTQTIILFCPHDSEVELEKYRKVSTFTLFWGRNCKPGDALETMITWTKFCLYINGVKTLHGFSRKIFSMILEIPVEDSLPQRMNKKCSSLKLENQIS